MEVFTVGHSNLSIKAFIYLLQKQGITFEMLINAGVRRVIPILQSFATIFIVGLNSYYHPTSTTVA